MFMNTSKQNSEVNTFHLQKGKLRHYNLGRWLRERYSSFLSNLYKPDEIKIYSSDHDVCLLSAQSNLAGLYKLNPNDEWLSGLPWDPIPVHTRPSKEDSVVALLAPCAKYDRLYAKVKKLDVFANITRKYERLVQFLSKKTGWNIDDIDYIRGLYQIFEIYSNYNTSYIPVWADDFNQKDFTQLAALAWARETYTPELKRLKTGPFFDNLFAYFDQIIAGKEVHKFRMLASSIKALSAVLNTMDVFDNHPVQFAATIIWELSKNTRGKDILTMYYKNSDSSKVTYLKLKGCASYSCEYSTVKSVMKSYIVNTDTWVQECQS